MDALDAMLTRRSIRAFLNRPVTEAQIETILRAGMEAPSAGNQQPWRFIVITERDRLDAIPRFHPYSSMVPLAPLAILVCADTRDLKHDRYWAQDCAAATQNILLAAHAIGLGAVWLGVYPREDRTEGFYELCGIPREITPFSCIVIGHPAESKPPGNRFDPDKIHRETW